MGLNTDWFIIFGPVFLLIVGLIWARVRNGKEPLKEGLIRFLLPLGILLMNPLLVAATAWSGTFSEERRSLILGAIPVGLVLLGGAWWVMKRSGFAEERREKAMRLVAVGFLCLPAGVLLLNGAAASEEQRSSGKVTECRAVGDLLTFPACSVEGVGEVFTGGKSLRVGDQVEVRWATGLLGARRTIAIAKVAAPEGKQP